MAGLVLALSSAAVQAAEPSKREDGPGKVEAPVVQPERKKAEAKVLRSDQPKLRVNDNYLRLGIANDAFVGSAGQR
ncbi:hypothetical protein GCM10007276_34420 [Agaricicola taiwanensis]|uniref:Uncharacterized protein n=2 Tax=Agaricicola taiwanensis TaxID=591372 RepID=A0A8J2YN40_9RHOB|nr:hypothetical protein GCM10007276_34420 [Agaricicola taiwanensis]